MATRIITLHIWTCGHDYVIMHARDIAVLGVWLSTPPRTELASSKSAPCTLISNYSCIYICHIRVHSLAHALTTVPAMQALRWSILSVRASYMAVIAAPIAVRFSLDLPIQHPPHETQVFRPGTPQCSWALLVQLHGIVLHDALDIFITSLRCIRHPAGCFLASLLK